MRAPEKGCAASPGREEAQLPEEAEGSMVIISEEGTSAVVTPVQTEAAVALLQRLAQGAVQVTLDDYGGFEKVGDLGFSLPQRDVRTTAQPGDIMLYRGDQMVVFYGQNTWSYTPLGSIALRGAELSDFLHAGEGEHTFTLALEE